MLWLTPKATELWHIICCVGIVEFALFLHLRQKAGEEFVFVQICICTNDITVKHQGDALWTNHHMRHEV